MNQQAVVFAAQKIRDRVDPHGQIEARQDPNGDTIHHFLWMCDQVISGRVHGRKSHRWLGYLQCAMVFSGEEDLSLEAMKALSRRASDQFPEPDLDDAMQALDPRRRKVVGSAIRDMPDVIRMTDAEANVYRLLGRLVLESGPLS